MKTVGHILRKIKQISLLDKKIYQEIRCLDVVTLTKYDFIDLTSKTCESGSWYQSCINCKEENKTGKCIGTIFIYNFTPYTTYQ